jgi:monooxygenase
VLLDVDYARLPTNHNYLLSMPQRHLLAELAERCTERAGFERLDGYRATDLVVEDGRVRGVVCSRDGRRQTVRAFCVIAADGRYSNLRRLAGIRNARLDLFDLDVLWMRVPLPEHAPRVVQIFRSGGEPVLAYPSYPDALQLGWTIPHGRYADLTALGVDRIRDRIAAAVPQYAEVLRGHLTSFADLSLLDVFAARAERDAADGLLLIGDAAHTHSPLGAQGINLAIQDAVAAHPVLIGAWHAGDASADRLAAYSRRRAPHISAVTRIQVMQSKGMLSTSRIGDFLRPKLARVLPYTPMFAVANRRIALGDTELRVRSDLFPDQYPEATRARH